MHNLELSNQGKKERMSGVGLLLDRDKVHWSFAGSHVLRLVFPIRWFRLLASAYTNAVSVIPLHFQC